MSDSQLDKIGLEKSWLELQMADDALWRRLRVVHRNYVLPSSRFVVWAVEQNRPVILQTWQVHSFALHQRGLSIVLQDADLPGRLQDLSHDPVQLPGHDIFLWIPAFSEVRFTGKLFADPLRDRRVSMPLMSRQAARPDQLITAPGTRFFSSQKDFLKYWPSYNF